MAEANVNEQRDITDIEERVEIARRATMHGIVILEAFKRAADDDRLDALFKVLQGTLGRLQSVALSALDDDMETIEDLRARLELAVSHA